VERIEKTVDALRQFRQAKYAEQQEIEDELNTLKNERSTVKQQRNRRERVDKKRAEVESEIEQRESKIEDLEAERQELREKIQTLEKEVAELEEEDRSEFLNLQNEVNRLELELERLEDDRDQLIQRIDDREDKRDELDQLRRQRENVVEQLQELRNRVNRIENEAIEEFNTHMEKVLDILEYENLDRIWLDRIEQERRKGRKKVSETVFRLHVVRSDSNGVAYEDEFEHLSESEREVTALIFALAGYLAHDVHEEVPFLLLDSLEAIDAQRVDTLLDYLSDYAEYLIVTLLPEDANEVETPHQKLKASD
jgi:chromosome segregation ATPase